MTTFSSRQSSVPIKDTQNLDTNVLNDTTDWLYINGEDSVGIFVKGLTGTYATHVVILEISPNGSDAYESNLSVTGEGCAEGITASEYVRAKVKTAEGAVSTCEITIIAK